MGCPVAIDVDFHTARQSVHDRRADAVEPTGCAVCAAAELAAGVKLGEHDFKGGDLPLLPVDRDAAAVVGHLIGVIVVERDFDEIAMIGSCFVDAVVDDLPQQVRETA